MPVVTAQAPLSSPQPQNEAPRQPITPEAPASEVKPADPMAAKFARLAQDQKRARAYDQQLKAREAALKAKEQEYQTSFIPKANLKQAALEAMQRGELSYEEFTQAKLNDPVDPYVRGLEAKLAALEEKQAKFNTQYEEAKSEEYKQAVNQIREDVKDIVLSSKDFETIKDLGQEEAVVALIEATFEESGKVLSISEAAKEVEDYLVEEAFKMASLSKIKARLAPAPTTVPQKLVSNKQPHTTLTNAITPSLSTGRKLNERERIENAKLVGQGLPKKYN